MHVQVCRSHHPVTLVLVRVYLAVFILHDGFPLRLGPKYRIVAAGCAALAWWLADLSLALNCIRYQGNEAVAVLPTTLSHSPLRRSFRRPLSAGPRKTLRDMPVSRWGPFYSCGPPPVLVPQAHGSARAMTRGGGRWYYCRCDICSPTAVSWKATDRGCGCLRAVPEIPTPSHSQCLRDGSAGGGVVYARLGSHREVLLSLTPSTMTACARKEVGIFATCICTNA